SDHANGKFLPAIKSFATYNKASKFIIKYFNNTSFGFRTTSLIAALEYGFVNDYVICFDDLERKGKSLEIKEVMGLVDELARKKNCKIILIFNEKNLDDKLQEKQFSEYREKIVDLDIMYNPTTLENLSKVFLENDKNGNRIENIAKDLNIRNLRILAKIKYTLDVFDSFLKTATEDVKKDFANRVALFSVVYYSGIEKVQYEDFKTELNTGVSDLPDDDGNKKEESAASIFVAKLDVRFDGRGQHFDNEIDFYLRHGYINPASEMNDIIKSRNKEYSNLELNNKINNIWSTYRETFDPDDSTFVSQIVTILEENLHEIPLEQLGSFLEVLEALDMNIDGYIEKYSSYLSALSEEELTKIRWYDMHSGYEKLDVAIQGVAIIDSYTPSIEKVITRLSFEGAINSRDVTYLNSFSEDEYYKWIMNCKSDALELVRNGLLKFTKHNNPTPEMRQITEKAIRALNKVSETSKINELRVDYLTKYIK
ncbi:TPA: hypothetical protein R3843_004352, partial [Salmonella enterica subsp. enterica serovar Weltevreden]|nr:hypothetical protein [Salmonella enterica subsp. enterica serovar Weltevreden]